MNFWKGAGIGIGLAVIWAALDVLSVQMFGLGRTTNIHITTVLAAAAGAWIALGSK